ncbi:MAG: IS5 family transposase [Ardenticatenaceae bacterium]|nr:IS5 family transposase [Ardenticatenaceae bacterium]MCB9444196.1 IS5 family transposase [Ardenticatenaceae bacterium]
MKFIHRQAYQSDLKDQEWKWFKNFLPQPSIVGTRGRPQKWPMREIVNAMLYLLRTGCQWRMLPHDLPPWPTVYYHYRKWRLSGVWEKLNQLLHRQVRQDAGREPTPSAAIVDAQSVKTTLVKGARGFDAGKRVKGRKRHIVVDTLGWLLLVLVTPADVQDKPGGKQLLTQLRQRLDLPRLKLVWADGGYGGQPFADWVRKTFGWVWQVVKRSDDAKGFHVLPRRWVVERTFGWLNNYRRLSKDYEELPASSESLIYLAMSHIMVRRLAKTNHFE